MSDTEEREHLVHVDQNGEPDECVEDCPGCHWEGNTGCESLRSGCATCDPDDVAHARSPITTGPRRAKALAPAGPQQPRQHGSVVQVPEETAETLVRLGWAPPGKLDEAVREALDDAEYDRTHRLAEDD